MLSLWQNRPHETELQDPKARRIQELEQKDDKNTAATTCTSDNVVTLLCNQEDRCHVAEQDVEWVMDSTTSYHCVLKREYFSTYKVEDFGTVKMGNKSIS